VLLVVACMLALAAGIAALRWHSSAAIGDHPPAGVTGRSHALPTPKIVDHRLAAPFSLSDGQLQLSPPPAGVRPVVSAADALAIVRGQHDLPKGRPSSVFLASLTSYARSTTIDPSTAALVPDTTREPVWAVLTAGVRVIAFGVGVIPRSGAPDAEESPAPLRYGREDQLVMLDATTGAVISGIWQTMPDRQPSTVAQTPDPGVKTQSHSGP
jgi:hypothetical protein